MAISPPHGRPNTSPLPIVPPAIESEVIIRIVFVVALVLQITPELHVLCEEPTSPMSLVHQMVDSPEVSLVPLHPTTTIGA
jgi:hypothetical protein